MSMSKEELLEVIAQTEARIKYMENRPPEQYRRGDAESIMNDKMFLSIMKTGLEKEKELGRELTTEENHQILRDHGWTVDGA